MVRGAIVDASIGSSPVGDALMFQLGFESAGLKSYGDGRWLVQWDALVAGRAGVLAQEHPYLSLLGAHALAWAEGGVRFLPSSHWSPYLGVRLGNEAQISWHPGAPLSAFTTAQNVDGVGGVSARGAVRIAFGGSFLDERRSVLLTVFVQEDLQAREPNTPGQAFTEGGIHARFDLMRSITATLEGFWGVTLVRKDPRLGLTDQTTRMGGSVLFRKIFPNGMWLSASVLLSRDTDHTVYGGGRTFDTATAPTVAFALLYGLPLWRAKR